MLTASQTSPAVTTAASPAQIAAPDGGMRPRPAETTRDETRPAPRAAPESTEAATAPQSETALGKGRVLGTGGASELAAP